MNPSPNILGWSDQGGQDGCGMWLMGEKRNAYRVWWVNLKKRDNLQHLGVDGSIILTLLRQDGLLIKYPQFTDVLNTLNVQPYNIFLLMF